MRILLNVIVAVLLAGCAAPKPEAPTAGPEVSRYTLTCSVATLQSRYSQPADLNNYDLQFLKSIEARWIGSLAQFKYSRLHTGKVTVRFLLYSDGRVTRLERLNNQVGETQGLICQQAILDPAPYAPWPPTLRPAAHSEYREFLLTFNYQ